MSIHSTYAPHFLLTFVPLPAYISLPTCRISLLALSSLRNLAMASLVMAVSLMYRAVLAVSLRLCTKMRTCRHGNVVKVSIKGGTGKVRRCTTYQSEITILFPLTLPLSLTHLVLPGAIDDLLVADLVHELEALQGFLHVDADVLLIQRAGTVAIVKVEQTLVLVHPGFQWGSLIVRFGCKRAIHSANPSHLKKSATSSKLGSVADSPTIRVIS